jgi:opacity protein-like surface antigen
MRWTAWVRGAVLALAVATTAFAADVTGKWKAQYQTPDGQQRESTFTFAVSGETLTGTVVSAMGEVKIEEGKTTGDTVTFSVTRNFQGNDVKIRYNGKVAGDTINFTVSFGDQGSFDIVAKKQTS